MLKAAQMEGGPYPQDVGIVLTNRLFANICDTTASIKCQVLLWFCYGLPVLTNMSSSYIKVLILIGKGMVEVGVTIQQTTSGKTGILFRM